MSHDTIEDVSCNNNEIGIALRFVCSRSILFLLGKYGCSKVRVIVRIITIIRVRMVVVCICICSFGVKDGGF